MVQWQPNEKGGMMITQFVNRFMEHKAEVRAAFAKAPPTCYKDIVDTVVKALVVEEWGNDPWPDRHLITEINYGDYSGTLVYVIGSWEYALGTHWYVTVGYGSCSGCDTLQAIQGYLDGPPTEQQLDDYMTLALHIVQGIKVME